jgi:hypothetical protein
MAGASVIITAMSPAAPRLPGFALQMKQIMAQAPCA